MTRKFLDIFRDQTPAKLAELKRCIADESWEDASVHAHSIKTQCLYLSLDHLAGLALEIETLAEQKNDTELIPDLYAELEDKLSGMVARIS